MLHILVLEPDDNNRHPFADDLLKAKGLFFFHRRLAAAVQMDDLRQAALVIALQGDYGHAACALLGHYVADGGTLVTFTRSSALLRMFDIAVGDTVATSWIAMSAEATLTVPCAEDLLCPGEVSWRLKAEGHEWLKLRTRLNEYLGPAILTRRVGQGRAVVFGYDPVAAVIHLRHGLDDFDPKPDTINLRGPRHIHALIGLADLYSQQVPIGDMHLDLVREILWRHLPPAPRPRVWHLPKAASSLYFLKSDGCGEAGLDKEIALAESFDAPVTFYRNQPSRFTREQFRAWHARGHGIGIELNLNPLTYGKSLAELRDADPLLRARIREFVADFDRNVGVPAASVCIHSCQWTGARMVRLLQEHGWSLADHFCGHDPRKNRHNYGPYCISSTLPMRYYDPEAGVLDFYLQPSQGDESQCVGWITPEERAAGFTVARTGFSLAEYSAMLLRFLGENDALYHGVHVGNWHPLYLDPDVLQTDKARFFNRDAFIAVMIFLRERGIARGQLEDWTRFTRARHALRVEPLVCAATHSEWRIDAPEAIGGVTLLFEGAGEDVEACLDGVPLPVRTVRLEQRLHPYVVLDLVAGQTVRLSLSAPTGSFPITEISGST